MHSPRACPRAPTHVPARRRHHMRCLPSSPAHLAHRTAGFTAARPHMHCKYDRLRAMMDARLSDDLAPGDFPDFPDLPLPFVVVLCFPFFPLRSMRFLCASRAASPAARAATRFNCLPSSRTCCFRVFTCILSDGAGTDGAGACFDPRAAAARLAGLRLPEFLLLLFFSAMLCRGERVVARCHARSIFDATVQHVSCPLTNGSGEWTMKQERKVGPGRRLVLRSWFFVARNGPSGIVVVTVWDSFCICCVFRDNTHGNGFGHRTQSLCGPRGTTAPKQIVEFRGQDPRLPESHATDTSQRWCWRYSTR